MTEPKAPTYICFSCERTKQAGHGKWEISWNKTYEISVCNGCRASNQPGWGPFVEPKIVAHMTAIGKKLPYRLSDGTLPYE